MIKFFIKLASGMGGKIIFAALLFSMIFVWGAGGLTSMSLLPQDAITVGKKKLSVRDLETQFSRERQSLSDLMGGQYISPQKAMEMGLLNQVVARQVDAMIFDGIKDDLGLTASQSAVRKYVEVHPAFQDATGHFDRNLFSAYLRQMKLNESGLFYKLQDELATQHLLRAVQSIAYAPDELVRVAYRYQNEQRDVTALVIRADKLPVAQKPTAAELQEYYEAYAEDKFITPEYRSFGYLLLTPEALADRVPVSDAEIDAVYADRRDQYTTPEKRAVSQMYFADEAAARAAMQGLTPANFDTVATQKAGQKPADTDFGFVAQNELMEELAAPVFAAKKNQILGPIEGVSGWHILLVRDIQPAKTTPKSAVRDQIKQQLAYEKAYDLMADTTRRLEDILGVGDSLDKAAKELKLPLKHIRETDITGHLSDGRDLDKALAVPELLQSLFTLQKGETTPLVDSANGLVVAQLDDIRPVGTKPFNSVRDELTRLWTADRQKAQMTELADKVIARAAQGTSLAAQSAFAPVKLTHVKNLTRSGNDQFSPATTAEVFRQTTGAAGMTRIADGDTLIISEVTRIKTPDVAKDSAAYAKARADLESLLATELASTVTAEYGNMLGVHVNTPEIDRAFSVYTTSQE